MSELHRQAKVRSSQDRYVHLSNSTVFEQRIQNLVERIEQLQADGCLIDSIEDGTTPLEQAAKEGNTIYGLALLRRRAKLMIEGRENKPTVLHYAARNGLIELIEACIEAENAQKEIFLAWQDEKGNTALHWAAYHGYKNVCKYLRENGASSDAMNNNNLRPADIAAQQGFESLARLLLAPMSDWENLDIPLR